MTDNRIQVGDVVNLHHARDGAIASTGHTILGTMDVGGVLFVRLSGPRNLDWIPVAQLSKVEPEATA